MLKQVERRGIWQTTFISRDDGAKPEGQAPENFATDTAGTEGGGWLKQELYGELAGETWFPRVVEHEGSIHLVYKADADGSLHVRQFTPGKGWSDSGPVSSVTHRAPEVVSHQGNLHVFYAAGESRLLREAVRDASGKWTSRDLMPTGSDGELRSRPLESATMPGFTAHDGDIHVVHRDGIHGLYHATVKDGKVSYPRVKVPDSEQEWTWEEEQARSEMNDARLSLVSHAGALHLIRAESDHLKHWIKPDGGEWAVAPDSPGTGTSQSAPSSVVYDGKIYTFYTVEAPQPLRSDDAVDALLAKAAALDIKLTDGRTPCITYAELTAALARNAMVFFDRTLEQIRENFPLDPAVDILHQLRRGEPVEETFTHIVERVGYQVYDSTTWSGEFILPVESRLPPSAAVLHQSGDPERGRLLLAYTGISLETLPPPPPPAEPGPEITARRSKKSFTALGEGGWSRLDHTLEATVHYNEERDVYHVKAVWGLDAWALNWANTSWRDNGWASGRIKLVQSSGHRLIADHSFHRAIDGHTEITAVWEVPSGDFELTLSGTYKDGGYYWPYSAKEPSRYSEVLTDAQKIDVTVRK
ncbi:hypothetical protein ACIA8F_24310 [Streptomyces sp. NPDC051563]|uniref:hypothetical protein n=1 Tax=Streptomyces sp. NPDC051563 TaxID=3365659 RepID=UPI003790200D